MPTALTVDLTGGLGNQLFKLAALLHVAKRTGRVPYIQTIQNPSPHSSVSYFDTILRPFRGLYSTIRPASFRQEPSFAYVEWSGLLRFQHNPQMNGYFQDYRYVDREFVEKLVFPTGVLASYPGIQSGVFLHIRGGDYIGHPLHDIGLDAYYERALAMFPGKHFFLVTNDLDYAQSKPFLRNIAYTVVKENEVDTLYIMSQCEGGICANSTFSWWGAYMNPNRKLVMPDLWYSDLTHSTVGYYFPGVIKCPVLPFSKVAVGALFRRRDESEPRPT